MIRIYNLLRLYLVPIEVLFFTFDNLVFQITSLTEIAFLLLLLSRRLVFFYLSKSWYVLTIECTIRDVMRKLISNTIILFILKVATDGRVVSMIIETNKLSSRRWVQIDGNIILVYRWMILVRMIRTTL